MTLHDELLELTDGNPIDAAARLAYGLMQDTPISHKVGYTKPNAVLAALEMFPEITPAKRWRFNTALDDLLEGIQTARGDGATARGGAS